MKSTTVALVAALVAPAAGLQVTTRQSTFMQTGKPTKGKTDTIRQVVEMLQTMMETSKQEAEAERVEVGKHKCNCDTVQGEKKTKIEELDNNIEVLSTEVSALKGDNGVRSTKVNELKNSLVDNAASLAAATETRQKSADAFMTTRADLVGAIDQLDRAIATLKAVGADQTYASSDNQAVLSGYSSFTELKSKVSKALSAVSSHIDVDRSSAIQSFLQSPTFGGNYAAKSGGIYGILENMRDTFATNKKAIEDKEALEVDVFDKFQMTKAAEEATLNEDLEREQAALADNDALLTAKITELGHDKDIKETTEQELAESISSCKTQAQFFDERNLERTSSDAAISKAISILNSDDAFENFKGARASMALLQVASSKGHVFNVLFEKIAKVVAALDKEKAEDEAMTAWCNNKTNAFDASKENLNGKIDKAAEDIATHGTDISDSKASIENTLSSLQTSRDAQAANLATRSEEHNTYTASAKHLSSSVKLIDQALEVLAAHYDQANLQGVNSGVNSGSSSAVDALKKIKGEFAKTLETKHEQEMFAQSDYEVRQSQEVKLQEELKNALADEKAALHASKKDLKDRSSDKTAFTQQLESESKIFAQVNKKCTWVAANKDIRETNREKERAALDQVKAKVRGTAKFQADCQEMPNEPICQE